VPNHSAWSATPLALTTPVPDTQAPSVPTGLAGSVLAPAQIRLTWNAATDNVGVTGYYVYLNNAPLATTTQTSFTHSGLVAGTTYNYRVSAYDAVPNHSAWTATPVSVSVPLPDTTPPAVGISSPAAGATVAGTISVSASASDNVGVAGVRFKLDGIDLGAEDLGAPYATSLNTTTLANGTHTLSAVARDAAGNVASSAPVTITVSNKDKVKPQVSITSPASGASVAGTITISASASDNVGVVGVQFRYNGINLGAEVTAPPYAVPAYTSSVPNGWYTLTAIARDAAGNTKTSAPVSVYVAN
jgi:chitodextrinase